MLPLAAFAVDSWKRDPSLIKNLASETQIKRTAQTTGYAFRLPEGYSEAAPPPEIVAQRQNGFDNHVYGLTRRSDGTAATLALSVATPPPGMVGTLTLTDALEGTLAQKKHQWRFFTECAAQSGLIDGLSFKRVYFKGLVSGAAGSRMAHGFAYVAIDGSNIVSFQAEDAEPYNEQSLPLTQAAVLTFRRTIAQGG